MSKMMSTIVGLGESPTKSSTVDKIQPSTTCRNNEAETTITCVWVGHPVLYVLAETHNMVATQSAWIILVGMTISCRWRYCPHSAARIQVHK
jgi:hypothetical protein